MRQRPAFQARRRLPCLGDYDDTLVFTLDDSSTLTVEFNAHNLRDGDTYRAFDDKGGLWKLLAEMSD